ncbi:unnamed protein product, partial [Rhizoctonia solani]
LTKSHMCTTTTDLSFEKTTLMSNHPDHESHFAFWESAPKDTPADVTMNSFALRPDDSKYQLLHQAGCLRGVTFNGPNGPYKCSRQVFRVQPNTIYSIQAMQACQDIANEEFYPANEIDARYIHMGWPAPGALPARPWDTMYQPPKGNSSQSSWVSRRMVIHKWIITLRKEDLVPAEAFTKAVEEALNEPQAADRVEALRGIFAAWGEMIPLAMVIGASLAATGTLGSKQTLTGDSATFRPPDRGPDGGYPETFSKSGFNAWLDTAVNSDNSSTWEVVKVNNAVPITDLLPKTLRQRIDRLFSYSNMITRSPSVGSQIPYGFDGASLGVKDIKQINVWHNGAVMQDISIVYIDGSVAGPYGLGTAPNNKMSDSFVLGRGEFITDVFVWATSSSINAMQFAKNTSQLSVRYGTQNGAGDPAIFTAGGNALLGFSGSCNTNSLLQIQAVWRSDVKSDEYRSIATSTIGSSSAIIFNDYRFLGDPASSYISKIGYRNTAQVVAGLQVTYSCKRDGTVVSQETPVRGTDAGARDTWTLAEDEHIIQVKGRAASTAVYQLEFLTNKGNTKKIGQEAGDAFTVAPPHKDMVLYYLLGKSAGYMQTIMFVWAMPSLKI